MKKIINIITPFYYPSVNGVSIIVQKNVLALLEFNYEVNIFSSNTAKPLWNENVLCFDLSGNGSIMNPIKGDIEIFKTKLLNYSKNTEMIILHGWNSAFTNITLNISSDLNTKLIIYSHGVGFISKENFFKRNIRKLNYFGAKSLINKYLKIIDGIIYITNNKNHVRCYDIINYKNKNKYYIYNTISERIVNENMQYLHKSIFFSFSKFSNDDPVCFCLSNYEEVKNQMFLIKLSYKLNFKLICVGSSKSNYYHKLVKLINNLNLSNQVLLLYDQKDDIIDFLFKESKLFLFASKNDFSPLVLIESMKYKLPFLSFETVDNIHPGGFYVKNNLDFENKLSFLLFKNITDLKNIGNDGFDYFNKYHSNEIFKKSIIDTIKKIEVI
jgi:hypothetical protein